MAAVKTMFSFRCFLFYDFKNLIPTVSRKYCFKAAKLTDRCLLRVSGSDALPFLQTLLTNDIRSLQHVNCLYSYLLNVASRILADLLIYKTSNLKHLSRRELVLNPLTKKNFGEGGQQDDQVLIECDTKLATPLAKTLFAFKLRKNVIIEMASEYDLWTVYPSSENVEIPAAVEVASEDIIFVGDPRTNLMGFRFITRLGAPNFNELNAFIQSLISCSLVESSLQEYREYRYKLGIAEGLRDLGHGKTYFFESNGHLLNACSPRKGLFVGEKVISKKKNYSQYIRPVVFEKIDSRLIYPGSILASQENIVLGTVRNIQGNVGIASLKIHDKFDDRYEMIHHGSQTMVTTYKPLWWSTAWNHLLYENAYQIMNNKINLNQMSLLN